MNKELRKSKGVPFATWYGAVDDKGKLSFVKWRALYDSNKLPEEAK